MSVYKPRSGLVHYEHRLGQTLTKLANSLGISVKRLLLRSRLSNVVNDLRVRQTMNSCSQCPCLRGTCHTGSGMTSRLLPLALRDRKFTNAGPVWKSHFANLHTQTELNFAQTWNWPKLMSSLRKRGTVVRASTCSH